MHWAVIMLNKLSIIGHFVTSSIARNRLLTTNNSCDNNNYSRLVAANFSIAAPINIKGAPFRHVEWFICLGHYWRIQQKFYLPNCTSIDGRQSSWEGVCSNIMRKYVSNYSSMVNQKIASLCMNSPLKWWK